ncbi:MAG: hypothetical protein QMC89_03375 [Candidatus Hodarchaeaceae archaeon]|nr:hypothetical protein [Candidatus Hodarchaeaceae archaeon]
MIRSIYQRYRTFLSQGAVYPLLYSLEGKGLLVAMKFDSRAGGLCAGRGGRAGEGGKINNFVSVQKYLLESIGRATIPLLRVPLSESCPKTQNAPTGIFAFGGGFKDEIKFKPS